CLVKQVDQVPPLTEPPTLALALTLTLRETCADAEALTPAATHAIASPPALVATLVASLPVATTRSVKETIRLAEPSWILAIRARLIPSAVTNFFRSADAPALALATIRTSGG